MSDKLKERKVSRLSPSGTCALVVEASDSPTLYLAGPMAGTWPHGTLRLEESRVRTPVSHKVIEKRRRDRINRCLNELGKTVPMALAKQPQAALAQIRSRAHSLVLSRSTVPTQQGLFLLLQSSGKLEKAEILEMTVQYLRALHSADFPRGREKAELLAEFANYFHYGYHECMKNLVHYLTTVERMETKDTKYARILAFLQSKSRLGAEPAFQPLGSLPEPDFSYQLHPAGPEFAGHSPGEAAVFPQGSGPGSFPWPPGAARSPYLPSAAVPLPSPAQQHSPFLTPVQCLDRHYLNRIGHAHTNALNLHTPQHPPVL
uniref:Helt bHLH transcription factor n=1 Tax=Saimiri boliviensis boliviensis TaxID=39432 RepID=A0A2K6SNG2_SAIBB